MREKLFILWVWALGITLAGTLIYGLVNFQPESITRHMIDHVEYRIIITVCVLLQTILWFWCVWSKKSHDKELTIAAYILLTVMLVSWIVLSNILTTDVHIVFVYICMGSLFFFILVLSQITLHENAVYTLYFSLAVMLASAITMIVLYAQMNFYIPEHIAFLAYDFVFTSFFTIHTYRYWNHAEVIKAAVEMYSADWDGTSTPKKPNETPDDASELGGCFYIGRGGLVWIPAYPAPPV